MVFLAARTVGFSRETYHVGVEGAFDSILAGVQGQRLEEKMYGGVWKARSGSKWGLTQKMDWMVYTTIDIELQDRC